MSGPAPEPPLSGRAIEVVRAGPLTTVQDAGRPGFAHLGVPRSGAVDQGALALANRLVGNPAGQAGLETTLGGVAVRVSGPCVVAVTGAPAPLRIDRRPVDLGLPLALSSGQVLDLGPAWAGVRSYVAVAGGIDLPPVLGSRSTDLLSGLGPAPLRDGDRLPVGAAAGSPAALDFPAPAAFDVAAAADPDEGITLAFSLGPRHDWFTPDAFETLTEAVYGVSSLSNRIALRLGGPPLERVITSELPSEGLVLGAIQVPADGRPLVFLADHPTTGGYPVLGVVRAADLGRCAQARPGARVRFRLSHLSDRRPADRYGSQP